MSYEAYEYPEDEQLKRISEWRCGWLDHGTFPVYTPWFNYIKSLWWMPDWGWQEYDGSDDGDLVRVYHISTGGWSGNESILAAMRQNFINWSQSFYIHKRGGHYEFRIPRKVESATSVDAVDPHVESEGTPTTRVKDDLDPLANVNEMGTGNIK